jgi:hypothetical protein
MTACPLRFFVSVQVRLRCPAGQVRVWLCQSKWRVREIEATCRFGLPTVLQGDRAKQFHIVFGPARHDGLGIHIASIHHMPAGQAALLLSGMVNRVGHAPVRRGRRGRFGMYDEVRLVVVTGLGHMHACLQSSRGCA